MLQPTEQPVQQAAVVDTYALTSAQAGMLFHALRHPPGLGIDVQQIGMTVLSPLDPGLFVYAWYQVLERHTVLRTRLRWEGLMEPVQEVLDAVELPVTRVDWRSLDPQSLRERLLAQASAERAEGFNLAKAPLMRLFMARVGDSAWSVLWTFHHAILDGRSFPLVLSEVFDIHDALRGRREPMLPLPMPFGRYVERSEAGDVTAAEAFWRGLLKDFQGPTPVGLDLPAGVAARAPSTQAFGARQLFLSEELTQALVQRAQVASLSITTLLHAAWALLLHRSSGSTDVIFGSTRSTRHLLDNDPSSWVGLFIATVPLRVAVDRAQTVDDWLAAIRAQQLAMRPHEHVPLARIQSWCGAGAERPLFETLVVYDNQSLAARMRALGSEWTHRHFDYVGQTGYPLTLVAYGDPCMLLRLEFDRRRFSDATAERLLGQLQTVLQALAEDRHEHVRDLPWLTALDREALLGRPPKRFAPGLPLHRQFEQQVQRAPLAPALTVLDDKGERQDISYARLNAMSNHLAGRLRARGVGAGRLVGLRVERNADVVLGVLAILKAGGAYLPLDPAYPRERAVFMLEDAEARWLLISAGLQDGWNMPGVEILVMEPPTMAAEPDHAHQDLEAAIPHGADSTAQDCAYVIYTSGSTGRPKGVPITHHNVARLFAATQDEFGFDERDVWTLFHSYAFDFSVWEMWGALLHGGRLVVVSQALSRDSDAFHELLVRERVTVLNQTPTAFRRLIETSCRDDAAPLTLRYVIFGGEALELQMLKPWFERFGDARPRLVNMYGITETTVHVTLRALKQSDLDEGLGSVVGQPLSDLRLLLLDPHGELVPIGAAGEIVVGGDGLSSGYLNRPELTAQRFVADTFGTEPGARLYRSGDLARWLDNGELEYLGRIDQQVKIRGFRIELGEIEAQLTRHPLVRQAAVVAREDAPGDRRLVAYVVRVSEAMTSEPANDLAMASALRDRLRQVLPDYMVPAHVVFVAELPLTTHGKLDVKSLPDPQQVVEPSPVSASLSPTQAVLAEVWASVLRVPNVDVHEHFFTLGGDSILSIQIVARCRQQGLDLSLKDLFEAPSIVSLSQRLDGRRVMPKASVPTAGVPASSAPAAAEPTPRPEAQQAVLPAANIQLKPTLQLSALTPIQSWFFDQGFADAHHWNQAFCFHLEEPIEPEVLQHAFVALFRFHPVLCQRFRSDPAGRWTVASSKPQDQARVVFVDLRHRTEAEADAEFLDRATEAQAGLNLARGPLLRALHFRMHDSAERLLIVIHHLVVDGVSWRILREDLESLVASVAAGQAFRLPAPTSTVERWVAALRHHATKPEVKASLPIWEALAARPGHALPQPAQALAPQEERAVTQVLRLGSEQTRQVLQQLSAKFGTGMNAVLLSSLVRALQARTGESAWRIDLEGHGREAIDDAVDLSRSVGWFTSLFPAQVVWQDRGEPDDASAALLAVQAQLDELPGRGLSYGVLRWMGDDEERARLASPQPATVLFNYLGQFDAVVAGSSLFRFAHEPIGPWRSPQAHRSHALELVILVRNGMLELSASHDASVVDRNWVADLLGAWGLALQQLLGAAGIRPAVPPVAPPVAPTPEPPPAPQSAPPLRMLALPEAAAEAATSPGPESTRRLNMEPVVEPVVQLPVQPEQQVPPTAATTSISDSSAEPDSPFPLTPLQRLFYMMDPVRPDLGLQQWQFVLNGPLNPVRLRRGLARVVERHDVLRAAFFEDEAGQVQQQPLPATDVPWEDEDWRGLSGGEPAHRLAQRLADELRLGFDLRKPPLMRVRLIRLADTTWHLIWTTHHLTMDGWSWPLVMAEWSRAYAALESGWASTEPPALQYRSFVKWQAENQRDHQDFWRSLLAGHQAPTPVLLRTRAAQASPAAECVFDMQEAQCMRLAALARRWRVTPASLAHAAWAVCLSHAVGTSRVLFGTTLAGRPPELPGVETLVGPCINNLPFPVQMQPKLVLGTWLTALQQQQIALAEHQYTPLEHIQQASAMAWRHRLFDSLVVFQNNQMDPDMARMGSQVRSTLVAVPETTNVPLTLSITPSAAWRLRLLAAVGSGLTEADLRLWVEDLMAALAALDALGMQEEAGLAVDMGDWLARMPQASAGRVMLEDLPRSELTGAAQPFFTRQRAQAPASMLEAELASVWQELLGVEDVPLTTNYFDMGVHSVLLVRAHRLINERLKLELPLVALMQHANIRALALHIQQAAASPESELAAAALNRVRGVRDAQRRRQARMPGASDT